MLKTIYKEITFSLYFTYTISLFMKDTTRRNNTMARKEDFFFNSTSGTTKIHAVRYLPDGEIKAILQITHGMVEYIERYEDFALFMASKGFLVTGHDHLGHGKSVNSHKELGYFAKEDGNRSVLYDIFQLTQITKEAYSNLPYFLLGHSMGSFYTRQYLCEFGQELDGGIIMGTGNQPKLLLQTGCLLIKTISIFKGWHYRCKFVNNMAFGSYNKQFEPARTNKDWLSKDTTQVDMHVNDPLCNYIFTLNAYYNMFRGMLRLHDKKLLSRMPKELPIFFVAGDMDPVGNFGKGVLQVAESFKELGMKKVDVKLYPNDRHEILNETDRAQVYQELHDWLITNLT